MTEAHEPHVIQLKEMLREPETEELAETKKRQDVNDPLEATKLQPRNRGSEDNKTEIRDIKDYYIKGEKIGHGTYSCVFAGVRKSDGKQVALKTMDKKTNSKYITIPGDTRSLPVEVALLELVCRPPHCPFVIQLLEWFETPNTIILVLDRPEPCVDLFDFFTSNHLTEDEILIIVQQIIHAARHCRERGVFHRDIKVENVLVNPLTLEVKLIDFGLGDLHKDTTYTKRAGTKIYLPPEFYVEKEYKAEPFTVWGLGVLLYMLLCGTRPFNGKDQIVKGHLFIPNKLSEGSKDLILWCMQRDPKSRPTLNQILRHPWFKRQGKSSGISLGRTNPLSTSTYLLSTTHV